MAISIYALDVPESRALLKAADVIFGVDVMTRRKTLMFGKGALERAAAERSTGQLVIVEVELDEPTDEPEWLAVAVTAWKGSCDYQPFDPRRRRPPRKLKRRPR